MRTFQHNQKKMLSVSQWKAWNYFIQRRQFIEQKGQNLLTSEEFKTNSPFYGMIARTKSYVFTEILLAVFPLGPPFWPAWLTFCIIWFSEQKSSSSKQRLHWKILRRIFPMKTTQKWRHLFVWILWRCNFFVIRYYLLTEDCRKAWKFKYIKT